MVKKKWNLGWYLVVAFMLGLTLMVSSCSGGTATPTENEGTAVENEMPAGETETEEHEAVEETEEETAGGIPMIPHTLEGRDDCLQCHGESGFMPFPADHAGRTSATCTGCHKPAS